MRQHAVRAAADAPAKWRPAYAPMPSMVTRNIRPCVPCFACSGSLASDFADATMRKVHVSMVTPANEIERKTRK
jgi:hypothetical protein